MKHGWLYLPPRWSARHILSAYNGTVQVMGAIAQDQGRVRVRISLVSARKTPELRLTLAVVTMPVSAGRASL